MSIQQKPSLNIPPAFLMSPRPLTWPGARLEAEFSIGKKRWKERFYAELKDPTIGGSSQTGVVEKVWDDIAIQVVKNILDHL